ncbi:MAG: hypothetical protein ACREMA_03215 [Longimicrobiales bacterium]
MSPLDLPTLVLVSLFLLAAALLAPVIPARGALAVYPRRALR